MITNTKQLNLIKIKLHYRYFLYAIHTYCIILRKLYIVKSISYLIIHYMHVIEIREKKILYY